MKIMAGMPGKQRKPFVSTDELASAVELNTFFTRFEKAVKMSSSLLLYALRTE